MCSILLFSSRTLCTVYMECLDTRTLYLYCMEYVMYPIWPRTEGSELSETCFIGYDLTVVTVCERDKRCSATNRNSIIC